MTTRLTFTLFASLITFVSSAFAQNDAADFARDLRSKYGLPLARETYRAHGIEIVVDYAANGNVCRIQLPPMGPDRQPGVESAQAVDNLVAELVPLPMRGKEMRRWASNAGLMSVSAIEYENLTIANASNGLTRTGVTITFVKELCRDQPAQ